MSKVILGKIFITLAFLFAYRILAHITTPGVDVTVIKSIVSQYSDGVLGLFNMFSGNAVERFSIISLGIMPYITASIIMELLSATFPALAKMKKERDGMQKYMQIIRYATIVITIIQAVSVSIGLGSVQDGGRGAVVIELPVFVCVTVFSMLAGTMLLMWIGEQITQRGVGNGISLIIFAGIVSGIPSVVGSIFDLLNTDQINIVVFLVLFTIVIAIILVIIVVELSERRVQVSYARKIIMQNQNKRIMNYIPIKINLSGVIPPIFASAILVFPSTLLQASSNEILRNVADILSPNGYLFNALMFLLVIFFAYFYSSIAFNAKDIADNLKRQGGFIPGMRPGENTVNFLNKVASNLTFWGSIYLALVTTLPWIIIKLTGLQQFAFGGTAALIVVQVAIDTMRKIEAQVYMNKYRTLNAIGL
ncbi:MAG: preprotein translocase subunit SecY [Helicobacter sp.]|uniref:preprotein translocase subunit SecY n=1 Tax=Helicobacter sp. 10-6591 TaxID=2004998 RepID=UPI000DCD8A4B|nr:preprotein translocase subunit SecY [Helicobacter sp. 10-6591]MCI7485345.1 preprotein translocase subunit SecY [Helicobacter sp.]MDD7567501.1 preprotein translocase subunit SecY [Helicobacter sp.]MDY5741025.1 preprotein translocase subunit SecY [Helicobacter sp.]RAX54332.1 preprotein translocase subunit SecY [Helicobacter sp. 10-6591]